MGAAPEISPTLDDAIGAMDRVLRNPDTPPTVDMSRVCMFLDRLDDLRAGLLRGRVALGRAQSEALEGAYRAGFRCLDESGHVLVVSLPALLAYIGYANPVARGRSVWAVFQQFALPFAGVCAGGGFAAAYLAKPDAALLWLAAAAFSMLAWNEQSGPSPCNQDCGQGDRCDCPQRAGDMADAYAGAREDLEIWKKRALVAEAALRKDQFEHTLGNLKGGTHAG